MKYISFYTPGFYEEVMNTRLLPTLIKFNLPYDIVKVEDKKNWVDNTSQKSIVIKDALIKHKEDILFLDADATIEQPPVLFDTIPPEYDIAVFYLDWCRFWHNCKGKVFHLLSGTLFMRYNDKILNLTEKIYTKAA